MILNCNEIASFLGESSPNISRIIFSKHYIALGGQYNRYLPKDCYLPETKTSETSMLIEKGSEKRNCLDIRVEIDGEHEGYKTRILSKIFFIIMQSIIGRNYNGSVWW